jgi:hypothetical protein
VLSSALAGGEWSASRPGRFNFRKRAPGTHWMGGSVDPKCGLDDLEKIKVLNLPGLKLSPTRSQSLYRLSFSGSTFLINV